MNSDDVLRDLKDARVERRRVFVSRSENNGKIRWVIEIESSPMTSQFNSRMKQLFDKFNSKTRQESEDGWEGEIQ